MWYWPLLSNSWCIDKVQALLFMLFYIIPPTFKVNGHCAVCTGHPCVSTDFSTGCHRVQVATTLIFTWSEWILFAISVA